MIFSSGASSLLFASATSSVTYHLHATSPAGNVQSAGDYAVGQQAVVGYDGLTPRMTVQRPSAPTAKVAHVTDLGNPDFRRNGLLMYWRGDVQGHVSDASAVIYAAAEVPTTLTVTLFGDGGVGTGGPIARSTVPVVSDTPTALLFDLSSASANVDHELVLSISAGASSGALVYFDSAAADSRITFALSDPADPPPPPTRTPAPGWSAVSMINSTSAHRETSLAIDPTDDNVVFACSPSGVPSTGNGQSYFHLSTNGGDTWRYLPVETGTTDPRRFAFEGGDCDVAFDAAGTMYSADTWLGSLSVGSSTDGGENWIGTSLAASAPVVDRPWLVGGPAGTVHVSWQDVQALMPSVIWYARSTDYGLTFTPAVPITSATNDGPFTWEGNLVVSPDQSDLYLVYTRRAGPAVGSLDAQGAETVWVAASHDGGTTWSQHLVAAMPNPASYLYPSIALDEGNNLHVVFSSMTDADRPIWYVTSSNEADSWSAPIKVLAGVAGWSPWVVGDGAGGAAIQWYGTLEAKGNTSATFGWYFFTARVVDGAIVSAGPTTSTPIFTGIQGAIPEFNQLRLDSQGRIHVGASAYLKTDSGSIRWALFHQRET